MRAVSMAPSRQCAADVSPAVWDHTVLPATRYRRTRHYPGIREEGQTSAYYCRNRPGGEAGTNLYCLVNRGTCVRTTCLRSLLSSAPARNRTRNLRVTSSPRYRYTTKPHPIDGDETCLFLDCDRLCVLMERGCDEQTRDVFHRHTSLEQNYKIIGFFIPSFIVVRDGRTKYVTNLPEQWQI